MEVWSDLYRISPELGPLLPEVRRARDFRLHRGDGRRLRDLWLRGGFALLGHKGGTMLGTLKNSSDRGLFSPLPSPYYARYQKALSALFPGRHCSLYPLALAAPPEAPLWRPFGDPSPGLGSIPEGPCIPVLPSLFPEALCVYLHARGDSAGEEPSRNLSPVILSTLCRGIHDLLAAIPRRASFRYPALDRALGESTAWRRRGIYLYHQGEDYPTVFKTFLEKGYLLPPNPQLPAILPPDLSKGEEKALAHLIS